MKDSIVNELITAMKDRLPPGQNLANFLKMCIRDRAGRVHAIGAGCFIAEIQQTSNITYRIYDYNRKDANGNGRELHTELAKDAIDYTLYPDYRTHYKGHTNATVELADCKYFTTNLLDLDTIMVRNFSELDSFVVYICMAGKASIRDNKGNEIFVHQGQTVLIPADTEVDVYKRQLQWHSLFLLHQLVMRPVTEFDE